MPPSGIRRFFDLVLGMKDVISLGVGEPDFVTPWNIREKAIQSIEQGYTSYTSNKGLVELRKTITKYVRQRFKLDYDPDEQALITVGVSEALDLAVRAITNPGDKILVPQPCYVSYGAVTSLAGGKPVYISTKRENGFKLTPKEIDAKCDRKTKAILLNYPANPTGVSYNKQELLALNRVCKKHNLIVISDEIYGDLTYDFKHTPWPTLPGAKNNCIYLNGFSKGHAMTGWRIGYALGPKKLIAAMTKIHQYTMLCAPITGQMAAVEAIRNGASAVAEMKKEYNRRRQFIVRSLNQMGLPCPMPEGAFYVFPDISPSGLNCMEFANRLLKTQKVAVVPGNAFDQKAEYSMRMAYATNMDNLREAMRRIAVFLKKI